jgi:hypothetical protein
LLLLVIFVNHLSTPEITHGAMYEAVGRWLRGLPLYPGPSGEFVALAYNPLFTVVAAYSVALFGQSAASVRLAAMAGTLGSWLVIFLAVRRETRSAFFGLVAAGLFGAGYLAFDGYLDSANPDSWMLLCGLLGLYVLQVKSGWRWWSAAIAILCIGFWFKQQGVILVGAGLTFLTWRIGLRKATPYWIQALALAPIAYFLLGPVAFGDHMIYFTYEVPRTWTLFRGETLTRYAAYLIRHWMYLAHVALLAIGASILDRRRPNVWLFSMPFAAVVGFLGALDEGSEDNVFLVPAVWLIVAGVGAVGQWLQDTRRDSRKTIAPGTLQTSRTEWRSLLAIGILLGSFVLNAFNPRTALTPPEAWSEYKDLVDVVRGLNALVYMPDVGQLAQDYRLPLPVHWIHLLDLVRGQGSGSGEIQLPGRVLSKLSEPPGEAYILSNSRLDEYGILQFLEKDYVLVRDFEGRFVSLRSVPGRFGGQSWPRFLYAYRGNGEPANIPADAADGNG